MPTNKNKRLQSEPKGLHKNTAATEQKDTHTSGYSMWYVPTICDEFGATLTAIQVLQNSRIVN